MGGARTWYDLEGGRLKEIDHDAGDQRILTVDRDADASNPRILIGGRALRRRQHAGEVEEDARPHLDRTRLRRGKRTVRFDDHGRRTAGFRLHAHGANLWRGLGGSGRRSNDRRKDYGDDYPMLSPVAIGVHDRARSAAPAAVPLDQDH